MFWGVTSGKPAWFLRLQGMGHQWDYLGLYILDYIGRIYDNGYFRIIRAGDNEGGGLHQAPLPMPVIIPLSPCVITYPSKQQKLQYNYG